jgi:hypothetical protein
METTTIKHKYNIGDKVYYLYRNQATRDFQKLNILSTKIDQIRIKKDNSYVYICETKRSWREEMENTKLFLSEQEAIESYRTFRVEEIEKEFKKLDKEIEGLCIKA